MGYTVRLTNPDAKPWTRRDEIRQRLVNFRNLAYMAWLALWSDSAMFAAVFVNMARKEGDGLIASMTMKSGRDIQVIQDDGK